MNFSGTFFIALAIFVLALLGMQAVHNWIGKLVLFLLTVGAALAAMGEVGLAPVWSALVLAVLFIVGGISAFKGGGAVNKVFGFIWLIVGVFQLFPAIATAFGTTWPGQIVQSVLDFFQSGLQSALDALGRLFGIS